MGILTVSSVLSLKYGELKLRLCGLHACDKSPIDGTV
jgi:hypothetical protein